MSAFKPGDAVVLAVEGCPRLTAYEVLGAHVRCRWFGADGTLHEREFSADELRAAPCNSQPTRRPPATVTKATPAPVAKATPAGGSTTK